MKENQEENIEVIEEEIEEAVEVEEEGEKVIEEDSIIIRTISLKWNKNKKKI